MPTNSYSYPCPISSGNSTLPSPPQLSLYAPRATRLGKLLNGHVTPRLNQSSPGSNCPHQTCSPTRRFTPNLSICRFPAFWDRMFL